LETRGLTFFGWTYGNKEVFFRLGYFSIKDGSVIRFWEDKWLDNTTLREQYLALYSIVRHKGDTIAKVMEESPPSVMFRRDLSGQWLVLWNALVQRLVDIHLQYGHDEFHWNLHESGKFSVASMYNALIQSDVPIDKITHNKLWKLKISLLIKVFGWYLRKGGCSNQRQSCKKWNWHGSKKYVLCHHDESIKHLFF
jgi:hypothetical protein